MISRGLWMLLWLGWGGAWLVGAPAFPVAQPAGVFPAAAQDKKMEDAALYLQAIETLYREPAAKQIGGWEVFLREHPGNTFRREIEDNLATLKRLQEEEQQANQDAARRAYYQIEAQVQGMEPFQALGAWEKLLSLYPQHPYEAQIHFQIRNLKSVLNKRIYVEKKAPPAAQATPMPPLAPPPPLWDEDELLYQAAVEGLVVPGIAHFTLGEYSTFGALLAGRAASAALITVGLVRKSSPLYISGAALYFVTYMVDIIGAPIKARELNEKIAGQKTGWDWRAWPALCYRF